MNKFVVVAEYSMADSRGNKLHNEDMSYRPDEYKYLVIRPLQESEKIFYNEGTL